MDLFHKTLRASLEQHVKRITLGHIEHIQDVVQLRDELIVRLEVTMNGASA